MSNKQKTIIAGSVVGLLALVVIGTITFMGHGTIQSGGFCGFCHKAFYDPDEYAFNDKVKMEKPSGVLTGCAECHPQPYAEFKGSAHFETEKENLRPGCANCHAPHSVFRWFRYMFYNPENWQRVRISIHDNSLWENEVRPDLAKKARLTFIQNQSKLCKDCHLKNNNYNVEIKRHKVEIEAAGSPEKVNCIKCHYNLVHNEVDWDDKEEMLKGH